MMFVILRGMLPKTFGRMDSKNLPKLAADVLKEMLLSMLRGRFGALNSRDRLTFCSLPHSHRDCAQNDRRTLKAWLFKVTQSGEFVVFQRPRISCLLKPEADIESQKGREHRFLFCKGCTCAQLYIIIPGFP